MKKAGLCVRYDCDNFGSMLQIFATQNVIKNVGWDYEIIRYDKRTIWFYVSNITRVFNPYFMKGKIGNFEKNRKLREYSEVQKGNAVRLECINQFRKKYIGPYSTIYKGFKNIVKGADNYDAIIVGSDQLWTPAGIKSKFYNLLFVPDYINKVSFATSFGVSNIPLSQRKLTAKYLDRINYLSVREIRGAEIIDELIGRKALVALDPTLMYNAKQWKEYFPYRTIVNEPYILAYFLGDNELHRDVVDQLKKDTSLKVITIPFMDTFIERDLQFGDEQLFDVGPEEFLNLIRGAKYICTDSFHGTVFSILNHKQFIVFNRTNNAEKNTRNSRIDSLLSLLNLENRRFQDNMNLYFEINKNIDYEDVDRRLDEQRTETLLFLNNALNNRTVSVIND